jgi:hypothetical protein
LLELILLTLKLFSLVLESLLKNAGISHLGECHVLSLHLHTFEFFLLLSKLVPESFIVLILMSDNLCSEGSNGREISSWSDRFLFLFGTNCDSTWINPCRWLRIRKFW